MGRKALSWILTTVAASVAGAALGAGPANAEVTVTPAQAWQGAAAKLTFHVTEDRATAHTTRIELRLPESTPVAETYPMSVPDWAPQTAIRTIDRPLGGIHHGQTTEVVAGITWTRVGRPGSAGVAADLTVSLGPMPQTDRMTFTVVQTYSDGVVTSWSQPPSAGDPRPEHPAPVLTLLPAAAATDADPGAAGNAGGADPGTPASAGRPAEDDGGLGLLAVGLVAGLLFGLAVGGWFFARNRRAAAVAGPAATPVTRDPNLATGTDRTAADPTASGRTAVDRTGLKPHSEGGASDRRRAWRLRE